MGNAWRRGSTPTNIFKTNINLIGATVFVTYSQGLGIVVEKTGDDLIVTEDKITVRLTQEDTLNFKSGNVEIQIRYVLPDGTADASNILTVESQRILKNGVITHV